MDPLWSEICWSTFKYFIILIVSIYYILCISWIIKCLNVINAGCKHEDAGLPVGVQQPNKKAYWSAWLLRWNHDNSLKHWKLFTQRHSTTFQKTWIFSFPDLNVSFLKSVTLSLWAGQCMNGFEFIWFLWTFGKWFIKEMTNEIMWNANLMQQGNFIDVFLAWHVSGTYTYHQEH